MKNILVHFSKQAFPAWYNISESTLEAQALLKNINTRWKGFP